MDAWVEQELQECHFPDQRLRSRMGHFLGNLGGKIVSVRRRTGGAPWGIAWPGYFSEAGRSVAS